MSRSSVSNWLDLLGDSDGDVSISERVAHHIGKTPVSAIVRDTRLDFVDDSDIDSDGDKHIDKRTTKSPVDAHTYQTRLVDYSDSDSDVTMREVKAISPVKYTVQRPHQTSTEELKAVEHDHAEQQSMLHVVEDDFIELIPYHRHGFLDTIELPSATLNQRTPELDLVDLTHNDIDGSVTLIAPSCSQVPGHAPPNVPTDLYKLSKPQRMEFYRALYDNNFVALKDIRIPSVCEQFPHLSEEIIHHYMRRSTFSATIWLNYDAAENKFYADDRIEFCGKLKISKALRSTLEKWEDAYGRFSRVLINICTPFRTLGWILLGDGTTENPGIMVRTHQEHKACRKLASHFNKVVKDVQLQLSSSGHHAFGLDDLDLIADSLLCKWSIYARRLSDMKDNFVQPIANFRETTLHHSAPDDIVIEERELTPQPWIMRSEGLDYGHNFPRTSWRSPWEHHWSP